MVYLEGYENRRHIWHAGRVDLHLGDAEGLTILTAVDAPKRTFAQQDLHVVEVRPGSFADKVQVWVGKLGSRTYPRVHEVPRTRRLDDLIKAFTGAAISRALIVPGVVWPAERSQSLILAMWAVVLTLGVLLGIPYGMAAFVPTMLVGAIATLAVARNRAQPTAIHRAGNKKPYTRAHVLMRLTELPATPQDETLAVGSVPEPADRKASRDRVRRVKESYGALLTDLAYRIENSALFDPAVAETRDFTLLLARWDNHERLSADDVAALSREIQLAFEVARAHAEALGLSHLPTTARAEAGRALKAARTAERAATDGERRTAIEHVNRILGSLALYYLPDRAETTNLLGGSPPALP